MKNTLDTLLRCLFSTAFAIGLFASAPSLAQDVDDDETVEAEESAPPTSGALVDVNTATEAQLVELPGIGPSKARAIIAFREQRPFRRVEDLMRVRGIGRGTFRQLRPLVTVGGTAPAAPRATARASSRNARR
jgi:competence ComEA-like helix-hairpin-helix protein